MLTCNLHRRNGELICDCTFADKLDFFSPPIDTLSTTGYENHNIVVIF